MAPKRVGQDLLQSKAKEPQRRFGIAEWYGRSFVHIPADERRAFAAGQLTESRPSLPCPFLSRPGKIINCTKPSGICSLRQYDRDGDGNVFPSAAGSSIRTTCPNRFDEDDIVYRWISSELLSTEEALVVGEMPFLTPVSGANQEIKKTGREVGRIDRVLVVPGTKPLSWCPVEKQAVYFSGKKMQLDFTEMSHSKNDRLPFPTTIRRPDYRSSGPKRLMPQLQVKVPTLSRWGKKMAVVVDEDFFKNLGDIPPVNHLSDAEVVWFIVTYAEEGESIRLRPSRRVLTTLDASVRGLIAAEALPQDRFEEMIAGKAERLSR